MADEPDEAYHAEVIIKRKPWPERKTLFVCCICDEPVEEGRTFLRSSQQHEPVCNSCTRHWGFKASGPVFNRLNYKRLQQLSAMTSRLQWEIRNGRRNLHR
jgi:hypothetical protein